MQLPEGILSHRDPLSHHQEETADRRDFEEVGAGAEGGGGLRK